MVRLVLFAICVAAVVSLLLILAGLLQEWMAPAAQPRWMHVAKFYPARKREELVVIPMNPPKRQFPRNVGERIVLPLLVAIAMAFSLCVG